MDNTKCLKKYKEAEEWFNDMTDASPPNALPPIPDPNLSKKERKKLILKQLSRQKAIEKAKKEIDISTLKPPVLETGIVNLRFEDCRISNKGAEVLAEFMRTSEILTTLAIVKAQFENELDFKKVFEGA